MSLTAGIVGLPNVGKSTLFNAITKKNILAANYPFATIDPNVGVVTVPDKRLEYLNNLYLPKSYIPILPEKLKDKVLLSIYSKSPPTGIPVASLEIFTWSPTCSWIIFFT